MSSTHVLTRRTLLRHGSMLSLLGPLALAALLAGQPLKFVQMVYSRPRETAILVLPQSGMQQVTDLVGKKVAANRSGLGEYLLIAALGWAAANQDAYIQIINKESGYPPEVVAKQAAYHTTSTYAAMTPDVVAQLQKSADRLAPRKIIPDQIEVARYAVDISAA